MLKNENEMDQKKKKNKLMNFSFIWSRFGKNDSNWSRFMTKTTCMAYIYYSFNARCINMYMSLNGTEHIYTVTARLHKMIYVVFHARRINMHMSLNRT